MPSTTMTSSFNGTITPRAETTLVYPSEWSDWDKCSRTCGQGTRYRSLCADIFCDDRIQEVEVCNDFDCNVPVCEDDYFDLILLVHQSEKGTIGKKNWENIIKYIKKIIKNFKHSNPGPSTYRISIISFGRKITQLTKLNEYYYNRDGLFDKLDNLISDNKKLVLNNDSIKKSSLADALVYVRKIVTKSIEQNEKSGRRTMGGGGATTIVGIISDILETDIKERTKLKKRAIELKKSGLYQTEGT